MSSRSDALERANSSKQYRDKVEERKGTEWYDNALQKGLQDPSEQGGRYSGAEVRAEMRHGRDGKTTEEMSSYYQGLVDNNEAKFNNNAKTYLSDLHGVDFGDGGGGGGNNAKPPEAEKPPEEDKSESAERYRQNAVSAVNSNSSVVNGNDNNINQTINNDNSSFYEGNTSTTTINGGGKDGYGAIMSKLSIADSRNPNPNDSNKGGQAWVNYWKNASNGLDYNNTADQINRDSQSQADDLSVVDTSAINTQINKSIDDSYNRALAGKISTYGDIYHKDYKAPAFENSAPDKVEQPDFESMYNDLLKRMK